MSPHEAADIIHNVVTSPQTPDLVEITWLPDDKGFGWFVCPANGIVYSRWKRLSQKSRHFVLMPDHLLIQIKPNRHPKGYLWVRIGFSPGIACKIDHLVLGAVCGPRPPGYESCHKNDVKDDNRIENLYWGTSSQNKHDSVRNGLHPRAGHGKFKFSAEVWQEIIDRAESGEKTKLLSVEYGVTPEAINQRRRASRQGREATHG